MQNSTTAAGTGSRTRMAPLGRFATSVLVVALAVGCSSTDQLEAGDDTTTTGMMDTTGTSGTATTDTDATTETTDPDSAADPDATTDTGDDGSDPGVPGANVPPDDPDNPNPEDPPGTGTIPAIMIVDGEDLEANACEVVGGQVRVRAGDGVTDTGVVVGGAAAEPTMTLLDFTGGVDASAVTFEAVADDVNGYTGTFDPAATDGIETVQVSYNLGVLPCPDNPES